MDYQNPLVLERECPGGFTPAVAAFLREQIATERANDGARSANHTRHLETVAQLANYVSGLSLQDQRMRALALCQQFNGFSAGGYTPGRSAKTFLARVGLDK